MYKLLSFSPIQEVKATSVSPPPVKPIFARSNTLPSILQSKLKRRCGAMDEADAEDDSVLPKSKK